MSDLITLEGLTKRFGALVAVDGIDLRVAKGEVLGFLGPNGAGKSTTMKMVAGFLPPTAGRAEIAGFDVVDNPLEVKRRIGYLPEGAPSYGDMTPKGFLDFVAETRGFRNSERRQRVDEAVEKTGLETVLDQSIETLSKGFKRRVGLAQAILHDPEVLILDEPTDGLDPNQKHHVRSLIRQMASDKAIVISTHILEEVEAVCTRAVIIANGRLVADGTAEELQSRLPTHNAVIVVAAQEVAEAVQAAAATLDGVGGVETLAAADGAVRLRILPGPGRIIAPDVIDIVKTKNLTVHELFIERGSLDDVFRQITMAADQPGGAHA